MPSRSAEDAGALRAARRAVAAVFFLDGVGVASWVVRIPDVQARLALSAGALGTVLLASALGALAAMPVAGRWVVRHGSRPVTARAALAFAASLPFIPLAPTPALLAGRCSPSAPRRGARRGDERAGRRRRPAAGSAPTGARDGRLPRAVQRRRARRLGARRARRRRHVDGARAPRPAWRSP
jgi:hypothetical protein